MRIELKGKGLTLTIKGQQIALCPEEALAFQSSLSKAVEELAKKKAMESVELRSIRQDLNKSKQRSNSRLTQKRLHLSLELFSTGYIDDGFALLSQEDDALSPADYISSVCDLDIDGWVQLDPQCPVAATLGVCLVASMVESEHPIGRMWSIGCFDALLIQAAGMISPLEMPGALQPRLFALLAQEVHIPSGQFQMGSDEWNAWGFMRPSHMVELTRSFTAMRFPVTQYLYWLASGENPSSFFGATRPVESLSWRQACLFCNDYSALQGLPAAYRIEGEGPIDWIENSPGYRLPTEAEWECMAKAWEPHSFPGSNKAELVGWIASNSQAQTHVVGQLQSNVAGLYDLCGNVWEWCWDWYDSNVYDCGGLRVDPSGPSVGEMKVCRGGGYSSPIESVNVGMRGRHDPQSAWSALGFRMVRTLEDNPTTS